MPGLYALSSWEALPLKSSTVKACANGYTLSITAHLMYTNPHEEPVEGIFIYPLEESEVVASFEAAVGSRRVTFQVQNRHRAQDCCLQCSPSPGRPCRCASGHVVLDEDAERSTFIIGTGTLCPLESLAVTLSTAQELPTLPDGALRLLLPPILTPRVPADPESEPASLCDDSPTSCFGGPGARSQTPTKAPVESMDVFRGRPYNPFPYEFAFELLVKGPCLLAGLESPSHALRADADPWASSATTTCVTLAEPHRYDSDLEIILYPCEPHHPHLVIEDGTMTYPEYEAHIRSRRDYVRIARKDSSGERQVAFVQRRFHKDIFPNPVLMLNFCPAVETIPGDLQSVTREILFLIDCSSSMSSPDLEKVKEALLVALKSLPSGTLLNIAGFGADVKPLFPSSRLCSNETLRRACEHLGGLRADPGSTNLLAALGWALAQPLHHGYPRQLFLFTGTAVGNAGRILRLVRRQASTVRCFSFGMGPRVCQQLLKGMARVSRGRAEFLSPAERLQPKLIKSLKKAIEPAVSDITIDWYVPDSMEALLSPTELPALYPGDRLVSYCVLYSIARFGNRHHPGREGACQGSRGSAFPSQEEVPSPGESRQPPQSNPGSGDASLELFAGSTEVSERSMDPVSGGDIWKRIYQPSYIQEQYVLTHCSVSTDHSRGLLSRSSTSSESTGSRDVAPEGGSSAPGADVTSQQGQKSLSLCESSTKSAPLPSAPAGTKVTVALSTEELARQKKVLARAALAGRSFSTPHGELDTHQLCRALEKVSQKRNQSLEGQLDELGPQARQTQPNAVESNNLLSPTPLDWDMLVEPSYLFSASPVPEPRQPSLGDASLPLRCQVVIHGLRAGKPVSWEVTASLESLLQPREGLGREDPLRRGGKAWDKPVHCLAARSVIRDNESAAQREAELEQGFARRFRLKAVQTSKACNVPSLYTRLVPVDSATQAALPAAPEVWGTAGSANRTRAAAAGSWHHRSSSAGQGQQQDAEEQDEAPGTAERDETPRTPASISSPTYGWEKRNCSNGPPSSPSTTSMGSQKSTESIAGSRFSLSRRRGPSLVLRPQCLSPESERSSNHAIHDYLPLVQLQQARGPFQLTESFSEVVQIPLDRLRRASPYASHRASLSPVSPGPRSSPEAVPAGEEGEEPTTDPQPSSPPSRSTCSEVPSAAVWAQADSGHGSESDTCPHSAAPSEAGVSCQDMGLEDLESASWATAVALAWLEHRCAGFFEEWELVAAKADAWLQAQQLPEGVDVGCLKGAARHLFLLLRHWDENIKLNMLCYNPNNV
ncbi:PREDICTED: von Willebrand factor A domain-containing protein 5B2 [Lepidothrix coronata]|uniref:von Willebrand factor A domain-containing protein 5B2 n=1 Tax=Lepidothrix coronata TaxID=321398 RepID=A0A6J0GWJ0_9PASS|nr:PREDICTED: von Willebrand factor A domain-containing protein 5B2 [Lepidothrix coronata]XP_017665985.1 PREDICTED: von Willebrand factor A domain-containing protein 5B2 [Lepidothrix coronata]XP_017665986.1 PREDICTED: von Willebrand factor A domain-containing protein 5B2 [Lepidothrix coronata]